MKLNDILKNVEVTSVFNENEAEILHVTNNSRECRDGSLFVAVRGFQTDGHKYIKSAVENGAVAIVAEEYTPDVECVQVLVSESRKAEALISSNFYGNPAGRMKLIGVTGTNGKTTVTYLVKHILDSCGFKTGLIGTNQNMIGDEILETGRTTPDSIELQGIFAQMAQKGVEYCIMEVSSHALELDRVYGCQYEVGAFTNLTQDHLDFHITMENYAAAKAKLMQISRNAVVNADDSYCEIIKSGADCEVTTYSAREESCLRAGNIRMTSAGVDFEAGGTAYHLSIPGSFSVYNALCVIGIVKALGIDDEKIARYLGDAHGVKGRAEVVRTNTDYTVIIDYAHTPDGIENILTTVKGFAKGRVIIVFGCGGDRDNTKRPIMGEIAGRIADFCVVTSDNPRTENPMRIIEMVENGVKKSGCEYIVIESRYEAIRYALENAKKDDVIVLAGKGHETYQILNTGTVHFDEREVVHEILGE